MAERDKHLIDGIFASECEDGVAVARHVSSQDGQNVFWVKATNCEAAVHLTRQMDEILDFDPSKTQLREIPRGTGSGNFFGFSSDRWNSPWNPAGPKPNWRTKPPKDPRAN